MSKIRNTDSLVTEALENARNDRERILEAFEEMKGALKLDTQEDLQKTMLVGEKAVKLLEGLTRTNEQVVRCAQILERKESKKKSNANEEEDKFRIRTDDIASLRKQEEDSVSEMKENLEDEPGKLSNG